MAKNTMKLLVLADESGRISSSVAVVDQMVSGEGGPAQAGMASAHGSVVHEVEVPAEVAGLDPAKLLSAFRVARAGRQGFTLHEVDAREEWKAKPPL